jgi:uncharacterized damage-inducible protein DinB
LDERDAKVSSSTLLRSLFEQKAWANRDLFDQVSKLDGAEYEQGRQIAVRLLDHIWVVDRIFAAHLTGGEHTFAQPVSTEIPRFDELSAAVVESDQWYLEYVGTVQDDDLSESVRFSFTDGQRGTMTREEMLGHVIAHGSYHRGMVGSVLIRAKIPPPQETLTGYLHRSDPLRRR